MKKTVAIVLIAVHMVNMVGCYGVFAALENLYESRFSAQLDNDEYIGSDAIILKIPASTDISAEDTNYHRVEGKVLLAGDVYQLVKEKFHNGTLYIVCIKDTQSDQLRSQLLDYSAALADQLPGSKGKTSSTSIMDFSSVEPICLSNTPSLDQSIQFPEYSFSEKLNSSFSIDQPPRI